jgi:hypothetical protein
MGINTMIDTLLKGSMADLPLKLEDAKPLVLTKLQVETLQNLFFSRYPGLARWHQREGWNHDDQGLSHDEHRAHPHRIRAQG